jgi:hypothetical protein
MFIRSKKKRKEEAQKQAVQPYVGAPLPGAVLPAQLSEPAQAYSLPASTQAPAAYDYNANGQTAVQQPAAQEAPQLPLYQEHDQQTDTEQPIDLSLINTQNLPYPIEEYEYGGYTKPVVDNDN